VAGPLCAPPELKHLSTPLPIDRGLDNRRHSVGDQGRQHHTSNPADISKIIYRTRETSRLGHTMHLEPGHVDNLRHSFTSTT
jgi:hypothetical protein